MASVAKNLLNETTYWSNHSIYKQNTLNRTCFYTLFRFYNCYQTWYRSFPFKNILFWYAYLFTTGERNAVKTLLLEKKTVKV